MDPAAPDDRRRRRLLIAATAAGLALLILVGVGIYGLVHGPAAADPVWPCTSTTRERGRPLARDSAARCGTRRKHEQKQPPNRSAPCAFLSRHLSVVVPAATLCALHDTPAPDGMRIAVPLLMAGPHRHGA